jgi:hypothetical protein
MWLIVLLSVCNEFIYYFWFVFVPHLGFFYFELVYTKERPAGEMKLISFMNDFFFDTVVFAQM